MTQHLKPMNNNHLKPIIHHNISPNNKNNNKNLKTSPEKNSVAIIKLQHEIALLQEEVKDLEQILHMNRHALKISFLPFARDYSQHNNNNNEIEQNHFSQHIPQNSNAGSLGHQSHKNPHLIGHSSQHTQSTDHSPQQPIGHGRQQIQPTGHSSQQPIDQNRQKPQPTGHSPQHSRPLCQSPQHLRPVTHISQHSQSKGQSPQHRQNQHHNTNNSILTSKDQAYQHDNDLLLTSTIGEHTSSSTASSIKHMVKQVESLYEDNTKLYIQMQRLIKERNLEQSKALISEQICEEAQHHESEAVQVIENKLLELKKLLKDKELAIEEYEKTKPIVEYEGILLKYREVLDPEEQMIKLESEVNSLNLMVNKVKREVLKAQAGNQEWKTLNFNLMNELSKLKATFSSPLNLPSKGHTGSKYSNSNLNNSCMGFMNDPDSSDSEIAPPMEAKVTINTKENMGPKHAPVPKLDLTKAKRIQEINAKKSTQQAQQAQNEGLDPKLLQKLQDLEAELNTQKVLLSKEMISNKSLNDELNQTINEHKALIERNHALIKENKKYDKKWQKIYYTLEFYKEFYHKYVDLIVTKTPYQQVIPGSSSGDSQVVDKANEKYGFFDINEINPDRLISKLKKINEQNGKMMNISILDANEVDYEQKYPLVNSDMNDNDKSISFTLANQLSRDQCKIYLLNLAKDLHVNTKLSKSTLYNHLMDIHQKGHLHGKSYGNLLGYSHRFLLTEDDYEDEGDCDAEYGLKCIGFEEKKKGKEIEKKKMDNQSAFTKDIHNRSKLNQAANPKNEALKSNSKDLIVKQEQVIMDETSCQITKKTSQIEAGLSKEEDKFDIPNELNSFVSVNDKDYEDGDESKMKKATQATILSHTVALMQGNRQKTEELSPFEIVENDPSEVVDNDTRCITDIKLNFLPLASTEENIFN